MKATHWMIPLLALALFSCNGKEEGADAYGNFEAVEVIVSAESQGRILAFPAEEGELLKEGQVSVQIDTMQLRLKKLQDDQYSNQSKPQKL